MITQPCIKETAKENQIFSRLTDKFFSNGIIYLNDTITSDTADSINQQILYLISNPPKNKVIKIYINSYGGCVYSGLSIYDMLNHAKKKGFIIETVCIGVAMSMAAILLSSGTKGHRYSLPSSTIMLHQLSTGSYGKFKEFEIDYKEAKRLQTLLNKIIKDNTEGNVETLLQNNEFYSAEEAIEDKIIDEII